MKGAILPGVFEVTQESPFTEIMERLGIRARASHACKSANGIKDEMLNVGSNNVQYQLSHMIWVWTNPIVVDHVFLQEFVSTRF